MGMSSRATKLLGAGQSAWIRMRNPDLKRGFGIPSHLTTRERFRLFELARNSRYALEIGSYIGASAFFIGKALERFGGEKLICVDTWQNQGMSEGPRDTWQEFQANTSSVRQKLIPLRGYSTEVVHQVRQTVPELDYLFIDGDHEYSGVLADWREYSGLMRPGGIVIFHDYGWAEGVIRVVEENVKPMVDEFDCLPNLWWGRIADQPRRRRDDA